MQDFSVGSFISNVLSSDTKFRIRHHDTGRYLTGVIGSVSKTDRTEIKYIRYTKMVVKSISIALDTDNTPFLDIEVSEE